jgi:hypothetical protein
MPLPKITLSVVSHRQDALVNGLLADLARVRGGDLRVVLTRNVPDPDAVEIVALPFALERIDNVAPKGFGANHNAAFARCRTEYFCIANPDVRLESDPFPALIEALGDERAGAAGPLVRSPAGAIEDSARRFPTFASLLAKALGGPTGPDYPADRGPQEVDWIGGMFMLLRAETFRAIGGFDENYFLYYEDVDLCRRLHRAGKSVIYQPAAEVVHDARRASRRNLSLMRHHAASMLRFLRG